MHPPSGAPTSPLFSIRQTPHSGRAVFATQDIPPDTLLWRASDLTLAVLLREYRREVCGHCFSYEHGRDLSTRDRSIGFSFCNDTCAAAWRHSAGEIGIQAWTAVEKLVKHRSKEDDEMVYPDQARPKPAAIATAWDTVGAQASLIRVAREGERDQEPNVPNAAGVKVTKQHRRAVQKALLNPLRPDSLAFFVSGLLWHYNRPHEWSHLTALAPDPTPYHSFADLAAFTQTYLHLLCVLPLPLLALCAPDTLVALSRHDGHNSFGIRSLEDDGAEFFGYGCWPGASYFNHSCAPNVGKRRVGREWEFRSCGMVGRGEELCISYLSGEERGWSKGRRMGVLRRNWGFESLHASLLIQ
ncbi:hypothetical protein EJ04DRAFT_555064 [Polyplosphaeria fusca]|uniref:SET domain-containing protein n=1 Tax=Polyplosphaeria fusca TaxID=682080 RepID=A0A9P4QTZ8_9PLEO|nr:hypothetical protein EJ04DRAFT_555064 [Polyplosphaeria fusca]